MDEDNKSQVNIPCTVDVTDRETLFCIKERAKEASLVEGISSEWQRAYQELADAANRLDAYLARSIL